MNAVSLIPEQDAAVVSASTSNPHDPGATGAVRLRSLVVAAMLRQAGSASLEFVGGSMFPLLRTGDRIRVRRRDGPPDVGDVVLYTAHGILILHRIVAIDRARQTVTTRGDSTLAADPTVAVADLLGYFDGLSHPTGAAPTFLPLGPRLWDAVMRRLVRSRMGVFQPALVAGCGLRLARRLVRTARLMKPRAPKGSLSLDGENR